MKYSLMCMLVCLFSLPAIADDGNWIQIDSGGVSEVYIKNTAVNSDVNTGIAQAWVKSVSKDGAYVLDKRKYACSKDEHLQLEMYQYDINNNYLSGGKIKPVWFSAIPESVGYVMMETVCMAAAEQELDKIELVGGGYTSEDAYTLIRSSFGKYADAVVMMKIQESMDNIEW